MDNWIILQSFLLKKLNKNKKHCVPLDPAAEWFEAL